MLKFSVSILFCAFVSLSLKNCHGQIVTANISSAASASASSSSSVSSMQTVMQTSTSAAAQAFTNLMVWIQPQLYPPNLVDIKMNLIELISSGELEVRPILAYISRFQNLDNIDLMIAALLALRDTLPAECPLKIDIGQLVVHTIFKRCEGFFKNQVQQPTLSVQFIQQMLSFFNYLSQIQRCKPHTCNTTLGHTGSQLHCGAIREVVSYLELLERLTGIGSVQQISPLRQSPVISQNVVQQSSKQSAMVQKMASQQILQQSQKRSIELTMQQNRLIQMEQARTALVFKLIQILPQPSNEIEAAHYNTIKTFLLSKNSSSLLAGINEIADQRAAISLLFKRVVEGNLDISIKEAFLQYSELYMLATYDYLSLLDLLPQPLDDEEREKIEIIREFLKRKDIYLYLKDINIGSYTDRKLLFTEILKAIVASKLDVRIVEAFTYYLNYEESLQALKLHTKKEITKDFELTKIFIDTLDVDSLSADAKLSFKKFFKFISSVNTDQLAAFDAWSEVKTKGEFMQSLFKYFLTESFVPVDVKQAIAKLQPLVKMDGRGALPP